MKNTKKALLALTCAIMLVVASVMGTMAYLTDTTETVTNTFTVGKVSITLDEAPVDADGKETTGVRVIENEYHLLPGHDYDKDPTVHVAANSENAWIFVKLENGLKNIIDATTVENQITGTKNGWTALAGVENVYYKEYTKSATVVDMVVFEEFKIDGTKVVNVEDGEELPEGTVDIDEYDNAEITIIAYAMQADGMTDAADAWSKF